MIRRAEKLEEQSKKLWTEAQKARARYAYLMEVKAVSRTNFAVNWPVTGGYHVSGT
jgi:hypothetical protein